MDNVNEEIRKSIRIKMAEKNWTQKELAEKAKLTPQFFSQIMTGKTGDLPHYWDAVLNACGLELTVQPKRKK